MSIKLVKDTIDFDDINKLIAVNNGIFISNWGDKGIKFFDHQNKKVY
jgi:uncharacterized membrane protein (DUF441 family)